MGARDQFGYRYDNITGSTLVHTGPGLLHSVTCNSPLTTSGTVSVYDGIDNTGTLIAAFALTQTPGVAFVPTTLVYDCEVSTGIYVDYPAQGPAGGNFTVTHI